MKLSFSTLGCPNWTWGEIISAAKDLGYNGIELRGIGDDIYMPGISIFSAENMEKTKKDLSTANLEISCIASDVLLCGKTRDETAGARYYIALAANIGAKCLRVLGDEAPQPGKNVDVNLVKTRLIELSSFAEAGNVIILVETNGIFADSFVLKELIEEINHPFVRVLWDLNHPVRYFGESPDTTFKNLGKYIRHIHVKDSKSENGKLTIKMPGYGDLPLKDCFKLLKSSGFEGYISLEWTKRWNKELEDAGIVFSQFIHMARQLWDNTD